MTQESKPNYSSSSGRVWAGIIIILIGGLLLLERLNVFFYFPDWMFSWPMILIIIGLVIGGKSNFKNPASFVMLGLGTFFLLNHYTDLNIGRLFWPLSIIIIGSWLIFGRSRTHWPHKPGGPGNPRWHKRNARSGYDWDKRVDHRNEDLGEDKQQDVPNEEGPEPNRASGTYQDIEYLDSVSVFGNVKKNILSKNFKGGEIVNIMGGADINLMQADIQGPVVLEVVQIFGGTKIIVPAHWKVHPEMAAIFGGVEDQRFSYTAIPDDTRVLYIKGTSIFGGITIKSI